MDMYQFQFDENVISFQIVKIEQNKQKKTLEDKIQIYKIKQLTKLTNDTQINISDKYYILLQNQWLDDQIIDQFVELTNKYSITPSCYFYTMIQQRCYEQSSLMLEECMKNNLNQNKTRIIFPINLDNMHWITGYINFELKIIMLFDSLSSSSKYQQKRDLNICKNIIRFLIREDTQKILNKQNIYYNLEEFYFYDSSFDNFQIFNDNKLKMFKNNQQNNGFDCGVYTLMNIMYFSIDQFNQQVDKISCPRKFICSCLAFKQLDIL